MMGKKIKQALTSFELRRTCAIEEDDNYKDDKNTGTTKELSSDSKEHTCSDYGRLRGTKISNKTHRSKTDPDVKCNLKMYQYAK